MKGPKKSILIINGNPDPAPDRLSAGLAAAYATAAAEVGHSVDRLDIGAHDFPLLRQGIDFLHEPRHAFITDARKRILRSQHLVFVFPIWLGAPPALLKGFMEQIACGGFALKAGPRGLPQGQLEGRSARLMVTMGMPAIAYRFWYGGHGVKAFSRSILAMSGIKPVEISYFGGVGSPARSHMAIAQAAALGRVAG